MNTRLYGAKKIAQRLSTVCKNIDQITFTRAWFNNIVLTGAVAPSSKRLARAMAFAAAPPPETKIIELGPGTGIVTEALIEVGVDEENLVLVEKSPVFLELLRHRFRRAKILHDDAFSALDGIRDSRLQYSAVVSSLPLLNYPVQQRRRLLDSAFSLLGPNGRIVQFTYGGRAPIPSDEGIWATRSRWIAGNIPPAVVWTYQGRPARRSEQINYRSNMTLRRDHNPDS